MQLTMNPPDSDLMTYAVRMVIPMKREFGRVLNVHQFLHDLPYATEVIQEALNSKDERLRGYAAYAQTKIFGPRSSEPPVAQPAAAPTFSPAVPAASETEISEDLRAKAIARYRSGLR
ncbi:hypothetical protein [Polaromonas aquatica]|uniref:hypothetical protein n=1 Tax=Polaromonas aquatica TaxID=332657 RepID=UPI003D65A775